MENIDVTPEAVVEALRSVYDGCCAERKISIVDMGLVNAVRVDDGAVMIELVLTTGWCPFSVGMLNQARQRLTAIRGVREVTIDLNWQRAWDPSRLDPSFADKLRSLPDFREVAERDAFLDQIRRTASTAVVAGETSPSKG